MKMPKRDQVVARRAATLAYAEADAEITRLRAEVEKLSRVRDAAVALRASHDELVASGWPVGSPEHCEWVKRDNAAFWNLRAALDAAKDES